MTKIEELIKRTRSGVVGIKFQSGHDSRLISSGSGFIVDGRLVSNSHVFNPGGRPHADSTIVSLRFGDQPREEADMIKVKYSDLRLVTGSHHESNDYAVYEFPASSKMSLDSRWSFKLSSSDLLEGSKVIFMGYPFGSGVMVSHIGYVSSIYTEGGVEVIKLDASVNHGNSGGPLLDIETSEVIGIVSRKHTALSETFQQLIASFDQNITALDQSLNMSGVQVHIGGVDPVAVLKSSQLQMKEISKNIERTANVGIGYAFSLKQLIFENDIMQPQ